jgi:hypothetical protein
VDDLVTALERGEGFGAEEVVGVGDQGGFHGGLSVGGSGGSGWIRPEAASGEQQQSARSRRRSQVKIGPKRTTTSVNSIRLNC